MATTVDPALFMLEVLQAEYLMHAEQGSFDPEEGKTRTFDDPPDAGMELTPKQRRLMSSIVERSQILTKHAFESLERQGWVASQSDEVYLLPTEEGDDGSSDALHSLSPGDVERVTEAFAVIRRAGISFDEAAQALKASPTVPVSERVGVPDREELVDLARRTSFTEELTCLDPGAHVPIWLANALRFAQYRPKEVDQLIVDLEAHIEYGDGRLDSQTVDALQYVASGQATAAEMSRMINTGQWTKRHAKRVDVSTHERREWVDRDSGTE